MAEKRRRKEGVRFRGYADEAGKVYERQVGEMGRSGGGWEERREGYAREKEEQIERGGEEWWTRDRGDGDGRAHRRRQGWDVLVD